MDVVDTANVLTDAIKSEIESIKKLGISDNYGDAVKLRKSLRWNALRILFMRKRRLQSIAVAALIKMQGNEK